MTESRNNLQKFPPDLAELRALAADLDPASYTATTYEAVLTALYVRGYDEGFAGTVTWPRKRGRASWVRQLAAAYKIGVDAGRGDRRRGFASML